MHRGCEFSLYIKMLCVLTTYKEAYWYLSCWMVMQATLTLHVKVLEEAIEVHQLEVKGV
jgi:hypothetical protein